MVSTQSQNHFSPGKFNIAALKSLYLEKLHLCIHYTATVQNIWFEAHSRNYTELKF